MTGKTARRCSAASLLMLCLAASLASAQKKPAAKKPAAKKPVRAVKSSQPALNATSWPLRARKFVELDKTPDSWTAPGGPEELRLLLERENKELERQIRTRKDGGEAYAEYAKDVTERCARYCDRGDPRAIATLAGASYNAGGGGNPFSRDLARYPDVVIPVFVKQTESAYDIYRVDGLDRLADVVAVGRLTSEQRSVIHARAIRGVRDPSSYARTAALRLLGMVGSGADEVIIRDVLARDKHPSVRWQALITPMAHPQAPMHEGMFITADSVRLFFRVVGDQGDTIVAIHGGPGVDLESIAGDFTPLTRRHVVIFYDQRGVGRSALVDTSRLSAQKQIDDLEELRRHFKLERMTLVAHSYGPLLAATYALAYPDRVKNMVLFAPVPPRRGDFWNRFRASMNERMDSVARAQLAAAGGRLADPNVDPREACRDYWAIAMRPRVYQPDVFMFRIKSDMCASDPTGIRYGLTVTNSAVMSSYGDWDLRLRLENLRTPTLVVHGTEDAIPMDLVSEWVARMPMSRLEKVNYAGHFVYAEAPSRVWPIVERFLNATLTAP